MIRSLNDLFFHELQKVHAAEMRIVAGLPNLARHTDASGQTKDADSYLIQTRARIERLEQLCKRGGQPLSAAMCPGLDGIFTEADQLLGEIESPEARAAAVAAEVQTVKTYILARYAALVSWARLLGKSHEADILQAMLDEEHVPASPETRLAAARADAAQVRNVSMGERLTSLFDRKT